MKLVDKSAVVAEIERRQDYYKRNPLLINAEYCIEEDSAILKFLDTLEAKEVDLEQEFDKCCENYIFNDLYALYTARRFFELGFKAKVG